MMIHDACIRLYLQNYGGIILGLYSFKAVGIVQCIACKPFRLPEVFLVLARPDVRKGIVSN